MNYFRIKSYAKINLSLNVLKKKSKKLHDIETLVTFIDLHDLIYIKQIKDLKHKIKFLGKFSNKISNNNTITNLLSLLDENKLLKEKKFEIKVVKNIPQKSGMGGGSINAASIFKFFLKRKIFKMNKKNINNVLKSIGSDVLLGMKIRNSVVSNKGKIRTFGRKLGLYTLIVKPNFGCSTKTIYSKTRDFSKSKYKNPKESFFSHRNIINSSNDLENVAFKLHPKLKNIKSFLYNLPKTMCVRMTGSGSCIVAYYHSKKNAVKGLRLFKKKYKNYWCIVSKTI